MGTLTDIRMACHQLAEPEFGHPADLVGWMGAMQAQDYTMSKWAVGLRLKSATIAQVNEALGERGNCADSHYASYLALCCRKRFTLDVATHFFPAQKGDRFLGESQWTGHFRKSIYSV